VDWSESQDIGPNSKCMNNQDIWTTFSPAPRALKMTIFRTKIKFLCKWKLKGLRQPRVLCYCNEKPLILLVLKNFFAIENRFTGSFGHWSEPNPSKIWEVQVYCSKHTRKLFFLQVSGLQPADNNRDRHLRSKSDLNSHFWLISVDSKDADISENSNTRFL
jgi:hypothetical protein